MQVKIELEDAECDVVVRCLLTAPNLPYGSMTTYPLGAKIQQQRMAAQSQPTSMPRSHPDHAANNPPFAGDGKEQRADAT